MKVLFIIGPQAVGKMTVGQIIAERTGFLLMHNHVAIESVKYVLGFIDWSAVNAIREVLYDAAKRSGAPGLIITSVIHFDRAIDKQYLDRIMGVFEGHEMSCLELTAPVEIRLKRACSSNRLAFKPSQRDIASSQKRILEEAQNHRVLSGEGELPFSEYLRVDTTGLLPIEVAEHTIQELDLRK